MEKRPKLKKYGWLAAVIAMIIAAVFSFAVFAGHAVTKTVSLEQDLRCQKTSHIHGAECYEQDVLTCEKPEHVHNINCYLVLLSDNRTDTVFDESVMMKERTLEAVIRNTVSSAIVYNESLDVGDKPLSVEEIKDLNEIIKTEKEIPELVLNENLNRQEPLPAVYMEDRESAPVGDVRESSAQAFVAAYDDADEPVFTMAVEEAEITGNNKGNIYAYVNDTWTCIGTFQTASRNARTLSAATINNALKAVDGGTYTYRNYSVSYATAKNGAYKQASYANGNYTLGNTNNTWYVRLYNYGSTTAPLKFYTIEYRYDDGTSKTETVKAGTVLDFTKAPLNGSIWQDGKGTIYDRKGNLAVNAKTVLTESIYYDVTFIFPDGSRIVKTCKKGQSINFGSADIAGLAWMAADGRSYPAEGDYTVQGPETFTGTKAVNIRFVFPDKTEKTVRYPEGKELSFSGDLAIYKWRDAAGNIYPDEAAYIANTDDVLIGSYRSIMITYKRNFPEINDLTFEKKPVMSSGAADTYSYSVSEMESVTLENMIPGFAFGAVKNDWTERTRPVKFVGWKVAGTDTLLTPGQMLSWEALMQYAKENLLELTGVWESHTSETCSFFLRYDSVAVDINGNIQTQDSNLYTRQLFSTFIENIDTSRSVDSLNRNYSIADTTADNSYTADKNIRLLAGESSTEPYLVSFPDDEDVFRQLKEYATHLRVDGLPVDVNDLDSNGYAIRWYVFKCQSDAWHVDGKLVRKEGTLEIRKTFAGNKKAVSEAKKTFAITVTGEKMGKKPLLLKDAEYNAETDSYRWIVEGMSYNEKIDIRETGQEVPGYRRYSEYSVEDALGKQSTETVMPFDSQITVRGMTYAVDTGLSEVMKVNFTNVYYGEDSIIIKKFDGDTGSALPGAEFELWQKREPAAEWDLFPEETDDTHVTHGLSSEPVLTRDPPQEEESLQDEITERSEEDAPAAAAELTGDVLLNFQKDEETGMYVYEENGPVTRLKAENGFYEIQIKGLSLDMGDIEVREAVVPEGYAETDSAILTRGADGSIIVREGSAKLDGGVLSIMNSSHTTSLTVTKIWNTEKTEPVTLQLMANGHLATAIYPALADTAQIVLSGDNGWSHTWDGLPVYANGKETSWTVREVRIGNEKIRDTGDYLNYLVGYSEPVMTENGIQITVTNALRKVVLRVNKTNWAGDMAVPGAEYLLQKLTDDGNGSFVKDGSFDEIRLVTNSQGQIVFDGIRYGRYLLTELKAPEGYYISAPVELTIAEDGQVAIHRGAASFNGAFYTITVRDLEKWEMPKTGGNSLHGRRILLVTLLFLSCIVSGAIRKKKRCSCSEK